MKVDESSLRFAIATLLAAAAASIAFYLWNLDLFTGQRVFGAMLGAELVIFSMLIYVYYRPSITGAVGNWLLAGCLVASAFLIVSIQLGIR